MKKFLAILMCGILLMSMVACTSNNDNSNPVTPNGNETTVSPETPTDPTDTTTSTNPPETTNPTDDNDGVEGDNTQNNETENGDSDNNDLPPENNDNTNDNGNDNEGGNDTDNKDNENGTVDNNDNENTNDSTDNNDDANNDNNNNGDNNNDNDGNDGNTDDTEDDEVVDPNAPHTPTAIEQQILDLINAEREKAGLAPLTYNADIYECAVIRANEALEVWSHTRPDGTKYWTVYEECGKKITNCCGENLAKTFKDPVQIVQMLMESEGHRKNILYEDFKSVCIVVLVDERGYYYMSQCFMG